MTTVLLQRMLRKLDNIEAALAYQYAEKDFPLGTTYSMTLHPVGNGPVIKLDFERPDKNKNVPAADVVATPGYAVSTLIVYNEGSAEVAFSTNREYNSLDASVRVAAGESFEIKSSRPSIARFSLVAPTSNSTVRVIMIV